MANIVAKFEKVSYEQFEKDLTNAIGKYQNTREIYDNIKLPVRATRGSAGHDFMSPITFKLNPGETITIPTGIRCLMVNDWVLKVYPRSGLGFKYRLQLNNTVGIIDSDYYYSDNEGHIMIRLTNDTNTGRTLTAYSGDGIAQGIFIQYGITEDDNVTAERNGGFGSTN